jgi:hypothetical protein
MAFTGEIFGPGGSAYGASSIQDLFFFNPPVDDRFVRIYRRHFDPQAVIVNQTGVVFQMPRDASVYLINKIYLELDLKLCAMGNDATPPPNTKVGPVNNVLHSVIKRAHLSIKNVPITTYNENYSYKAYLSELLEYNHMVKKAQLRLQGWEDDTVGYFDNEMNAGWKMRQSYFVKYRKVSGNVTEITFRDEPTTFMGLLNLGIDELHQGLVPETPWELRLDFRDGGFPVMNYTPGMAMHLKICNARIHVWMGLLNARICTEIQHQLNKKAAQYHFRGRYITFLELISNHTCKFWLYFQKLLAKNMP